MRRERGVSRHKRSVRISCNACGINLLDADCEKVYNICKNMKAYCDYCNDMRSDN